MNTPCIPTTYRLNSSGYGNCRYMGKRVGAHVAAYLLANNLTPDYVVGKVVMHKCDNHACVNPEHLQLGTQSENILDGVAKGRIQAGERLRKRNLKLSAADVAAIKSRLVKGRGGNCKELAAEFGVNWMYVLQVAKGYHDGRKRD